MNSTALLFVAAWSATIAFTVGCGGSSQATRATQPEAKVADVAQPTLVEIDVGVWVLRDSSEAIYNVGGEYWVLRDGAWWHSRMHDGGWEKADRPAPVAIVRRDHPQYVQFHGDAKARTRPAPKEEQVAVAPRPAPEPIASSDPPGPDEEKPGVGSQGKGGGEPAGAAPKQARPAKHGKPSPKARPASPPPAKHAKRDKKKR